MSYNRQLVRDFEHISESAQLLESLTRLDEAHLQRLLGLLSDGRTVDALRRLMRLAIDFKRGRGASSQAATSDATEVLRHETDLVVALEKLFNDQERFRSVNDIVKFAKSTLGINIPYQKQSRHAYVRRLLTQLRSDSNLLERASNTLSATLSPKDEAYSLLYNFIRGNR